MREAMSFVVEQKRLADLLVVGDQGQPKSAAIASLQPRPTLGLARTWLRFDVEDLGGLLLQALPVSEEELARGVENAGHGLVDDVADHADQAARAVLLPGVDIAGGRVGDGAQSTRDRNEHLV